MRTGVLTAIAIGIHNFPEGLVTFLGALVGYLILRPFINDIVIGVLFAVVAEIMMFISLDQLLPTARAYGKGHTAITGLVLGMAVMALSLLLLQ